MLLSSSTTSGYHAEYYSYALLRKLEDDGNKLKYVWQRSIEYPKYISSINSKPVKITFEKYNNKWGYKIEIENRTNLFESEEGMIKFLQKEKYLEKGG